MKKPFKLTADSRFEAEAVRRAERLPPLPVTLDDWMRRLEAKLAEIKIWRKRYGI